VATPHMMCPACLGHGKFRDDSRCETCKGTGQVTVNAGRKYAASTREPEVAAPKASTGRNAKRSSGSRAAKNKARKAGNQSSRRAAAAAAPGKVSAE
jgi:RecJ-like exonuclease